MKNTLDTLGIFQMFAIPLPLLETEGIFLSFSPWETSDVSIGKTHESVPHLKLCPLGDSYSHASSHSTPNIYHLGTYRYLSVLINLGFPAAFALSKLISTVILCICPSLQILEWWLSSDLNSLMGPKKIHWCSACSAFFLVSMGWQLPNSLHVEAGIRNFPLHIEPNLSSYSF